MVGGGGKDGACVREEMRAAPVTRSRTRMLLGEHTTTPTLVHICVDDWATGGACGCWVKERGGEGGSVLYDS